MLHYQLLFPFRLAIQRDRVHAEAFAGWRRAVAELMAEVGVAAAAESFGVDHAERWVRLVPDASGPQRLEKARPAEGARE